MDEAEGVEYIILSVKGNALCATDGIDEMKGIDAMKG